jgi:hypothetical protein
MVPANFQSNLPLQFVQCGVNNLNNRVTAAVLFMAAEYKLHSSICCGVVKYFPLITFIPSVAMAEKQMKVRHEQQENQRHNGATYTVTISVMLNWVTGSQNLVALALLAVLETS